ncbi:hypothetical protein Bphy_4123 [Paraburkholderia phymatum STM815]|uniref:Uncharacterized protein n=1 Tax=Paraburkholderia phymatum (strain DSM 17167 / CIP 108236 / LMG 21445 / STM815) TaxID=391038 RepID=B2JPQ3_PARP8|nr:hypothetical protein Bphy_4123 [Paraburkholderia phymatum STM815]
MDRRAFSEPSVNAFDDRRVSAFGLCLHRSRLKAAGATLSRTEKQETDLRDVRREDGVSFYSASRVDMHGRNLAEKGGSCVDTARMRASRDTAALVRKPAGAAQLKQDLTMDDISRRSAPDLTPRIRR